MTTNPNIIADSKHRFTRQYAARPAPLTGFGGLDDDTAADDHAARVHRHLREQLLTAWRTDPTLIVDGSKVSAAETVIDHLSDPAMEPVAVELVRLLSDAASGVDVTLRALLLMSSVVQHHADYFEAIQVERDHG